MAFKLKEESESNNHVQAPAYINPLTPKLHAWWELEKTKI
jgi:hypothetical protein